MWLHHSDAIVTKEQLLQLKGFIRELQPNCLVNSRLGLSIEEDGDIDFKTLGDNQLGETKEDFPWQTPATVVHSWGFSATENEWKSTSTLLKALIENVSLNGNMMLNIGPRANGDIPHEISQRLKEMGQWLAVNGSSIYGAQAFDLDKSMHDWGHITCKKNDDGKTLVYLHIYNWPFSRHLPVTGIKTKPSKVYLLADKQKAALKFNFDTIIFDIDLPKMQPDNYISTIVLEFDTYPETDTNLAAKSVYGGYSLNLTNMSQPYDKSLIVNSELYETVPKHLNLKKNTTFQWRVYIEKPMELFVDASYNYQGKPNKSVLSVEAAGAKVAQQIMPTGRVVGEPNSDWHIDSFNSHRIGKINFTKPGYYDITLNIQPGAGETVDFQWVWLGV